MDIFTTDMAQAFAMESSFLEIFVRGSIMYLALFLMLRFIMRRSGGNITVTDMLVIVMIADAAQNGMIGDSKSITDGILTVAVIFLWDFLLDWLGYKYKFFAWLIHPAPVAVIRNGKMLHKNMRREFISKDELMTQLRENGVEHVNQVKQACVESDGNFSVIKFDKNETQGKNNKKPLA